MSILYTSYLTENIIGLNWVLDIEFFKNV